MDNARNAKRDIEYAHLNRIGARQRRARRQLNDDDDVTCIDLRDEPDRRLAEGAKTDAKRDEIDHDHHCRAAHGALRQPMDAIAEARKAGVEIAEEVVDRPLDVYKRQSQKPLHHDTLVRARSVARSIS